MLVSLGISSIRSTAVDAWSSSRPKYLGLRIKYGHRVVSSKLAELNGDKEYAINEVLTLVVESGSLSLLSSSSSLKANSGKQVDIELFSSDTDSISSNSSSSNNSATSRTEYHKAQSATIIAKSILISDLAAIQSAQFIEFTSSISKASHAFSVGIEACKCEDIKLNADASSSGIYGSNSSNSSNDSRTPSGGGGNPVVQSINESISESHNFFKSLYADFPKLKDAKDDESSETKEEIDGLVILSKLRRKKPLSAAEVSSSKLASVALAAIQCADVFKVQNQALLENAKRHTSSVSVTFAIEKELEILKLKYDKTDRQLRESSSIVENLPLPNSKDKLVQSLQAQASSKDALLDALKAEVEELRKLKPDSGDSSSGNSFFSSGGDTKKASLKAENAVLKSSLDTALKEKSDLEYSKTLSERLYQSSQSSLEESEANCRRFEDIIKKECCSKDELLDVISARDKCIAEADIAWKVVTSLISLSINREELSQKIEFLYKALANGDFSNSNHSSTNNNLEIEYQSLKAMNSQLQQKLQAASNATTTIAEKDQKLKKAQSLIKFQKEQIAALSQQVDRLKDPSLNELQEIKISRDDDKVSLSSKLTRANAIILQFNDNWEQASIFADFQENQLKLLQEELAIAKRSQVNKALIDGQDSGQTSAESAAQIIELTNQMEQAQALINGYQMKIREAFQRIDDLEGKYHQALDEKQRFEEALLQRDSSGRADSALKDKLDNMDSLLTTFKAQNKKQEDELESTRTKLQEYEDKMKSGAEYVEQLHKEIESKEGELGNRLKIIEEKDVSLNQVQKGLATASIEKATQENIIKQCKSEIESLKTQIKTLNNKEMSGADKRLNMLTEQKNINEELRRENQTQAVQIATLKSQYENKEATFNSEHVTYQTKLNEALSTAKSLEAEIENLKADKASDETSHNSLISQLRDNISGLESEIKTLKSSQGGGHNSYGYEGNSADPADPSLGENYVNYAAVVEQLVEVRMQLAMSEAEHADAIHKKMVEIKKYKVQIDKLEAMNVANGSSGELLNELMAKNEELISQLSSAEIEIMDNHSKMEGAKDFFKNQASIIKKLENELAAIQSGDGPPSRPPPPPPPIATSPSPESSFGGGGEGRGSSELIAEIEDLQKKVASFEQIIEDGRVYVDQQNAELDMKDSVILSHEQEIDSLKDQMKSMQSNDTNSLSAQVSTLRASLLSKDAEIRTLRDRCSLLERDIQALQQNQLQNKSGSSGDAKYDEVREQLKTARQQLAKSDSEKEELLKKIHDLKSSISSLEANILEKQRKLNDLQSKRGFFG